MYTTLIDARELSQHLSDPRWLAIDCRFDLANVARNPDAGLEAYREGHIPGAIYAHLDRDLAAPPTPSTGRHPLPDPERFAETLSAWGIDAQTQVVAYDADTGAFAARLWWLMRWVGHRAVAVLDGGLKAWVDAGLPLSKEVPTRAPKQFRAKPNRDFWLDATEVQEKLQQGWRLLDARAPERYRGELEPIDPVAGHVPGAVNHPLSTNLSPTSRFLPPQDLRERYAASQTGVSDDRTIAMCGSGVTACHLLLAMEVAGKPGAKLYPGSWSEWIRDASRPIDTGERRTADGGR